MLYVASIGYHEVYVNGRKVGDTVLAPRATNHKKRARYCHLRHCRVPEAGQERARAMAGHVLVDLSALQERRQAGQPAGAGAGRNGTARRPDRLCIATDATWRTHPSPNTLLGVWDFMHYGGERYDANLDVPDWCEADFDDAAWKPAKVFSPRLTLSAEMVEPNRREKAIRPIAVEERPGGEFRVDMGVNFAGFMEIDLRGKPGKQIDMQFSERRRPAHDPPAAQRLHPRPLRQGHVSATASITSVGRWITIKGLEEAAAVADIRGWLVSHRLPRGRWFECSEQAAQ